jgi:signal transduction histidine kinase
MALYKHAAERQLRESDERLALAISAAQIGMFDWNLTSGSLLWTQTHEAIFGYVPSSPVVTTTSTTTTKYIYRQWADRVHPVDLPLVEEATHRCRQDNKPLEVQYRIIWPDGSVHWIETKGVFLHDNEQTANRMLGIVMDITERKMAEEALLALNEELERRVERRTLELQHTQKQFLHAEKLSAIGKLSASIAHEFNNPLQGIVSVLYGLKNTTVLEEEDKALLEEAIEEGGRIRDLIRNLQEFNRPSSGKKSLLDVHKTLDSVLLLNKSDFRGKRISVELDYAERLPQIEAVPDQIKQVFLNLLTNAADACMQSGGVITVSTRLEGEKKVAVEIKDTGFGIKPAEMELIFQPFYTTKSEIKGTGLGLSISYGIIKKHGGEINVVSQPGEGSTFTVILPIKGADDLP